MSSGSEEESERCIISTPRWDATSLTNGSRKSAFLPYKPTNTVLTNLQRGNTHANIDNEISLGFHEKSGQGEITDSDVKCYRNVDVLDEYQYTALHWAANYGQITSAKVLLSCGADPNKLAPDMVSPLLLAASGGHHEVVRELLAKGAVVDHMDITGHTALMYAAAGNNPHTCNELLNYRANIGLSNEDGETAYMLAIKNNAQLALTVIENCIVSFLSPELNG